MLFFTIIGILAIIIFCKFIYDTYLSENTNKDWEQYKKTNPHEARVIENNKGLDFNTNHILRTDGAYIYVHNATTPYGEKITLTYLLIFNKYNKVFTSCTEKMPSQEAICNTWSEMANFKENDPEVTEYYNNQGEVSFYFNGHGNNKEIYTGSVLKNGLCLTHTSRFYSEMIDSQTNKLRFKGAHFNFLEIN